MRIDPIRFLKPLGKYASFHDLRATGSDNATRIVLVDQTWHGFVSLVRVGRLLYPCTDHYFLLRTRVQS